VDEDLRAKVTCEVKGGETLTLNMMGKAMVQDAADMKELIFNTIVRKKNVQTIKVDNPDDREWAINPTISCKEDSAGYFTGKSTFIVPAKGSGNYEVVYLPKTMSKKTKKPDSEEMEDQYHQGSVFFPLPNGTAQQYTLKGLASAPQSEGTISETIEAKKQKNFIVKV
jgi:hydrocephalus-inducing protein